MLKLKVAAAKTFGRLSRASGRGGGTTLPGRILLKLDQNAIDKLGSGLEHGSTLISATNGKTTTASMLASILVARGRHPVHNRSGSNMTWGVATALLEEEGDEGLFEVDEAWLPEVARRLNPTTILLGNLFRDQLDRYGETETLADAWASLASEPYLNARFVLNADDPLIADIGRSASQPSTYFGIDDNSQALDEIQHAHDAKACRVCGHELTYDRAFVGHLGHYHCTNCGNHRPKPQVTATAVELQGMSGLEADVNAAGKTARLKLPLPGLYNLYNALGAIATAIRLGVPLDEAVESLAGMKAVFGRVERIDLGGTELSILLIKNPAGANEVLRTLSLEEDGLDLWMALNDRIADGRDVSWIWDADFELLADRTKSIVCSGIRADELALRLKYAGFDTDRIQVIADLGESLKKATANASGSGNLFALPTYTALLELRKLLADQDSAGQYWQS